MTGQNPSLIKNGPVPPAGFFSRPGPFWGGALVLAGFIAAAFWVYRYGIASVPRSDHIDFLKERAFRKSDWEYFWLMLSYSRTRLAPGDCYLFQPGKMGFLAVVDIFARHQLYVIGAISILLHALTVFSLKRLLAFCVRHEIAWLGAAFFLVQFSGIEMISWHHISPYMLGLFFLALGLSELIGLKEAKNRAGPVARAAVYFFLSSLFHEAIVPVMVLCGLGFWAFSPAGNSRGGPGFFSPKEIITVFFLPAAAYMVLNIADYFYFRPANILGPADALPAHLGLRDVLSLLGTVSGVPLVAFLMPFLVRFIFLTDLYGRLVWQFSMLSNGFFYPAAVTTVIFLLGVSAWGLVCYRKKSGGRFAVPAVFSAVYLAVLIGGLLFFRALLRGTGYIYFATYYYYMTNFFFIITLAILADRFFASARWSVQFRRLVAIVCTAAVLAGIVYDYRAIQGLLRSRHDLDRSVALATGEVAGFLKSHREFCYGGSLYDPAGRHVVRQLLYRFICTDLPQTPVYAAGLDRQSFGLVRLDESGIRPVPLDIQKDGPPGQDGLSAFPGPDELRVTALSAQAYDPVLLEVKILPPFRGGLVAAYEDPENFVLLGFERDVFYVRTVRQGEYAEPLFGREIVLNTKAILLTVVKIRGGYEIFLNRNRGISLPGIASLKGRVGLYDSPEASGRQVFSDVRVIEEKAGSGESGIFVAPVTTLRKPWSDPQGHYGLLTLEENVSGAAF